MSKEITPRKSPAPVATEIRLTIELPAGSDRAWKALTQEIHAWWPKEFLVSGKDSRMVLEPKLGGRVYEDAGEGNGVLWYQVVALDAPKSILLAGHVAPPLGGPATTLLRLTLSGSRATATNLEIHDSVFGRLVDCDIAAGWRTVFGGLSAHLR